MRTVKLIYDPDTHLVNIKPREHGGEPPDELWLEWEIWDHCACDYKISDKTFIIFWKQIRPMLEVHGFGYEMENEAEAKEYQIACGNPV